MKQRGSIHLIIIVAIVIIVAGILILKLSKSTTESEILSEEIYIQETSNMLKDEVEVPNIEGKVFIKELQMYLKVPESWYFKKQGEDWVITPDDYSNINIVGYPERIVIDAYDNKKNYYVALSSTIGSDVKTLQNAVYVKNRNFAYTKRKWLPSSKLYHDGVTTKIGNLGRGPVGYSHKIIINKDDTYIEVYITSMDPKFTKNNEGLFQSFIDSIEFIKQQ